MKKRKISLLKDNARFRISPSKLAATYRLHSKKKGIATYSSEESGRTFTCSVSKTVFIQ
ncbi:MAG: hypothetical protein ABIT05_01470 [Chitinophagaceae bacterium]